ncbi:MAG: DUF2884 family protein [Pseudomarimonas sp.]
MRRTIHRSLSFTLAAGLLTPMVVSATSVELDAHCDVESHYGLRIDADRLGFTRKSSSTSGPARIEFVGSSIHVDGQAVTLSAADRERVEQFQSTLRAMLPEVKQIARDSIDIAFAALSTVVTEFSSEQRRAELLEELQALRIDAEHTVATANSTEAFKDAAFERRIEAAVERIVPTLAGEFAAEAIRVAMSGDADAAANIERRANRFGEEIERSVEGAAKALEAKVARLCPQVEALDVIDNSFEWRLPDGSKVDFLEYSARVTSDNS